MVEDGLADAIRTRTVIARNTLMTTHTQAGLRAGHVYAWVVTATDHVNNAAVYTATVAAASAVKTYYFGALQVAVRRSSQSSVASSQMVWLHSDHLSSVSAGTDETGAVVGRQMFAPYGEARGGDGMAGVPWGWATHRQGEGPGLVYMRARWYAPAAGRFVSADTVVPGPENPQAFNRYAYALNRPLNTFDPSGHCGQKPDGSPLCPYGSETASIQSVSAPPKLDTPKPPVIGRTDPNTVVYLKYYRGSGALELLFETAIGVEVPLVIGSLGAEVLNVYIYDIRTGRVVVEAQVRASAAVGVDVPLLGSATIGREVSTNLRTGQTVAETELEAAIGPVEIELAGDTMKIGMSAEGLATARVGLRWDPPQISYVKTTVGALNDLKGPAGVRERLKDQLGVDVGERYEYVGAGEWIGNIAAGAGWSDVPGAPRVVRPPCPAYEVR